MYTWLPSSFARRRRRRRRRQEREARKAAEQEAAARSGEVRGLERRLAAALKATASAEQNAAASIEVGWFRWLRLSLRRFCIGVVKLSVVVAVLKQAESRHRPSLLLPAGTRRNSGATVRPRTLTHEALGLDLSCNRRGPARILRRKTSPIAPAPVTCLFSLNLARTRGLWPAGYIAIMKLPPPCLLFSPTQPFSNSFIVLVGERTPPSPPPDLARAFPFRTETCNPLAPQPALQDVSKITAEVRDARAGQRQAELWLEKSLAEVDAVHAVLAYERSVAAAGCGGGGGGEGHTLLMQQQTPYPMDHSMQTPHPTPHPLDHPTRTPLQQTPHPVDHSMQMQIPQQEAPHPVDPSMQTPQPNPPQHPPSPAGSRTEVHEAAVGPTAQTPTPESPTAILAGLGEGVAAVACRKIGGRGAAAGGGVASRAASTLPSFPVSPTSPIRSPADSGMRTPDLDVTRPELFSTARLRSRMGRRGRGMGLAGEEEDGGGIDNDGDSLPATVVRGEGARDDELLSPPTPTVLFGALASDGGSTTWGAAAGKAHPHTGAGATATAGGGEGEGDLREEGSAAAKTMAMRMATTPMTNGGGGSHGTSAREDVAASLLSMLRLETSKRKQAEARAAELEAAVADATAAAAALPQPQACGGNADVDPTVEGDVPGACGCVLENGDGAGRGFDGEQPQDGQASFPGSPNAGQHQRQQQQQQQQQQQHDPDWFAHYARMDQERQGAKILGLVRDARQKLEAAAAKTGSGGGGYLQLDSR